MYRLFLLAGSPAVDLRLATLQVIAALYSLVGSVALKGGDR